jgi:hypothetical protein
MDAWIYVLIFTSDNFSFYFKNYLNLNVGAVPAFTFFISDKINLCILNTNEVGIDLSLSI